MTQSSPRNDFWAAFSYPQYRLLWVSSLAMHTGRWMETLVVSWLVLELTDSPFLVGLVGACRTAGMLLGPFAGILADRFDRRRILIAGQALYAVAALTIMMLFFLSRLQAWHLFVFAIAGGISFSFDFAARFPVTAGIVKEQHLSNAVSLMFLTMGVTSGLGPLLGGSLLEIIGPSGCFAAIAGSFAVSTGSLALMKLEVRERVPSEDSAWKNLLGGFRYIRADQSILALILIAAVLNFFAPPISLTIVPIFARDILDVGANGLGLLMGAMGLGGLIGPLLIGLFQSFPAKGKLVIVTALAWPAAALLFSLSRSFPLSLVFMFFAGIAQWMVWALIQGLLLAWSAPEMHGRVSGVRGFAISALPFGNLLTGAMAGLWGAPLTGILDASGSILVTAAIALWATKLRRRR